MTKRWGCIRVFVTMILATSPALPALRDISQDKLPQNDSVRTAYAEAAEVEPLALQWSPSWRFDTPKETVAAALQDSLRKLQEATGTAPDNVELLLLIGTVARYASNVDVQNAQTVGENSLGKAQALAPGDYRAEWFLGTEQCQAGELKQGMEKFLGIENRSAWKSLPIAFWDDYVFCATATDMPAHVLRAGDYLSQLGAPASASRTFLVNNAGKRFQQADLKANYSGEQAWYATDGNSRPVFKSFMCGTSFSPLAEWKLRRLEVQNGLCVVQIKAGPHTGKAGEVSPSVTLLVRQAQQGETLADFLKIFMTYPSAHPLDGPYCPAENCITFESDVPNAYGPMGSGHPVMLVFKRDPPRFPGLLLEEPAEPKGSRDGSVGVSHPSTRLRRMDGTLYYLVMLDTADSVLDDAKKDYDLILRSLQAE